MASSVAGKIVVSLVASTARFTSDMNKAANHARNTGKAIDGALGMRKGGDLGAFTRLFALLRLVQTAAQITAGLIAKARAEGERMVAGARNDVAGVLEAELKVMDAQGRIVQSTPLIGTAIKEAMDTFGDRAGIEQAIKNIREVEAESKRLASVRIALARDVALKEAKLRGAPESEIQQIRNVGTEQETKATVAAQWDNARKAAQNYQDSLEAVARAESRYANARDMSDEWRIRRRESRVVRSAREEMELARTTAESLKRIAEQERAAYVQIHADAERQRITNQSEADRMAEDEARKNSRTISAFLADELDKQIQDVKDARDEAIKAAGDQWDKITQITQAAQDKITAIIAKAAEKNAQAMSDISKPNLPQYEPPPDEMGMRAWQAEKRRMDQLADEAKRIQDAIRTPDEVFRDEANRYRELLDAKLLSQEEFERAWFESFQRMLDAEQKDRDSAPKKEVKEQRFAPALLKGSVEAYQANIRSPEATKDRTERSIDRNTKTTADRLLETNKLLTELTNSQVTTVSIN